MSFSPILLTPGPTPVPQKVRDALSKQVIHHRTDECQKALTNCLKLLQSIFQTKNSVQILTSTGSGAMEAALTNTLSPQDSILIVRSGKFGDRWVEIAQAFRLNPVILDVEWGQSVRVEDIETALKNNPSIHAVCCQACETSTGALHPIKEIAQSLKDNKNIIFIVDAITALATIELKMDDWSIDILIAGSQKSFMLPTGVSFISLSDKAWTFYESSTCDKFYFDLKKEQTSNSKGQTFFSSPVHHIMALDAISDLFDSNNLEQMITKINLRAQLTRDALSCFNFSFFPQNPAPALTVINIPKEINGEAWKKLLIDDFNLVIMGGQDQLKGKVLRIGHMGEISEQDMLDALERLYLSYNQLLPEAPLSKAQLSAAHKCLIGKWN